MSSGPATGTPDMWQQRIDQVLTQGTESLCEATMQRWFTDDYRTGRGSVMVQRIADVFDACSDRGYAQVCEVLGSTDLSGQLGEISVPALLVCPDDDAFNWQQAEIVGNTMLFGTCPHVEYLQVPGRHMVACEYPQEVAAALTAHVMASEAEATPH